MGVMSCGRSGCSNIMCDTYIDGVGYLCNECLDELENTHGTKVSLSVIEEFMQTDKSDETIIDLSDYR